MAASETTVAELLLRLHEVRGVLHALTYADTDGVKWPVTLGINLSDIIFVRTQQTFMLLPPLGEIEEALGLLAILRQVDTGAWAAFMLDLWPEIPSERLNCAVPGDAEAFGVQLVSRDDRAFTELRNCHRRRHENAQSASYQELLQLVQDIKRGEGAAWRRKVPVNVVMHRTNVRSCEERAREISEMFRREDPTSIFCIVGISFEIESLDLGVQELRDIQACLQGGFHVNLSRLQSCELPSSTVHKLPLLHVLHRIFAVTTADDPSKGVMSLRVSNRTRSYWTPAILSAAHSSHSLRSIRVDNNFAELRRENRLLWVLYAVFSRSTPLKRLEFNCEDLEMQDVSQIRDFLGAASSLEVITNAAPNGKTRAARRVTASRFRLVDSKSEVEGHYTAAQPLTVSVLDACDGLGDTVRVLLPGYGMTEVDRADVLEASHETSSSTEHAHVGTISFRNVSASSSEAALLLLPVILPGVSCLEVEFSSDVRAPMISDWLGQFATTSTSTGLTELYIKGRYVDNLDTILDGFSIGTLHLSRLEIDSVLSVDSSSLVRFFDALSNRRHPLSVQLCELRMDVIVDTEAGATFVDSIKRMLRCNQRLMQFKLRIRTVRGSRVRMSIFSDIRDRSRDDMMGIPLEMRKKLAFVSVVATGSSTCPSVGALNASVMAMIFEFSATAHKRNVGVDVMNILPNAVYGEQ